EDRFFDCREDLSDQAAAAGLGNFQIWTEKNLDSVEDRRRSFLRWMNLTSTDTASRAEIDNKSVMEDNGGGAMLRSCDSEDQEGFWSDNDDTNFSRLISCQFAETGCGVVGFNLQRKKDFLWGGI
ncbi:hypothetical protein LINGRAHAP2_LOCUS4390, partial [Linum grandiflorum]